MDGYTVMRGLVLSSGLGLAALSGCGLSGGGTDGEQGQSRWEINDGLCPGLSSSCGLEVPIAVGAEPRLDVVTDCCLASRFDVVAVGPGVVENLRVDAEDERIDMSVRVEGPGEVILELREGDDVFDRVRFEAREAASMECGVVRGSADWQMGRLDVLTSSTETPDARRAQLGCRLMDADGEPLLSVGAIRWSIVEGPSDAEIDTGSGNGRRQAAGARVYLRVLGGVGEPIQLEARYMDFVERLEITILED
ncbi:MAG: hypothetical protein AB8I08_34515 [Sandaracinaceae bacterium]